MYELMTVAEGGHRPGGGAAGGDDGGGDGGGGDGGGGGGDGGMEGGGFGAQLHTGHDAAALSCRRTSASPASDGSGVEPTTTAELSKKSRKSVEP